MATPYDGKVAFWHWKGNSVSEPDIQTLATNLKAHIPTADAIWVKTSDGGSWQGTFDTKSSMWIRSRADITKWVNTLANFGLEFHAWAVLKGTNIPEETARVVEASSVAGVRSMVLDVEPYQYYWQGSRDDVIRLMTGVRNALGNDFHIGLCIDPRSHWYNSIFPDAWRPYVNSVHPMCYWGTMRRTPEDVLTEAYMVWGPYGLPIYPILQGHGVTPDSIREAQAHSRSVRGATGLSYWRLGVIDQQASAVIKQETVETEIGPDKVWRRFGWQKIVAPSEPGHMDGTHTGQPPQQLFTTFTSVRGHISKYAKTSAVRDQVWSLWRPNIPKRGIYEVSVYVPGRNATTRQGQYHIHGVAGVGSELLVRLDQSRYSYQWVPLVVYEFDNRPNGAQVNLTNLTGENDREIAFSAVRWREVLEQVKPGERHGFDSPVGTVQERLGSQIWPGTWFDATGFATYYTAVGAAYHTGADLNNNSPNWDADANAPVYAPADGVVTFSAAASGTWGYLIVIRHDPLPNGQSVWTRYAHANNALVRAGDRVERGQHICNIGNAGGLVPYHLHFDVAITNILEQRPAHWPGLNLQEVYRHYTDPKKFIQDNRPVR